MVPTVDAAFSRRAARLAAFGSARGFPIMASSKIRHNNSHSRRGFLTPRGFPYQSGATGFCHADSHAFCGVPPTGFATKIPTLDAAFSRRAALPLWSHRSSPRGFPRSLTSRKRSAPQYSAIAAHVVASIHNISRKIGTLANLEFIYLRFLSV